MGMDLCGYFCFMPQGASKIIKEHVKNINSILNETPSVKFIKDIKKKKSTLENPIDALIALGVDFAYYADLLCADHYDAEKREEFFESIKGDLEELMSEDPLKTLSQCRDTNSVQRKINGKPVDIIFAGQATWGDAPEGGGYQVLDLFSRLGFTDQFEKAIDWGNKKS